MTLPKPFNTSFCLQSKEIFKKILTGEVSETEENKFADHLAICKKCSRNFSSTLDLAHKLHTAFSYSREQFPAPGELNLPERTAFIKRQNPITSFLVDFSIIIILGFGLLFLLSLIVFGYRSINSEYETIWKFQAVQEVLTLTNIGNKILKKNPTLTISQLREKLMDLAQDNNSNTPQVKLHDPWNIPYFFNIKAGALSVRSFGPNKKDDRGRGDDITIKGSHAASKGAHAASKGAHAAPKSTSPSLSLPHKKQGHPH